MEKEILVRKLIVCLLVALLLAGTGVCCFSGADDGPESAGALAGQGGMSAAETAPDLSSAAGGAGNASDAMKDVSYSIGFRIGSNMAQQDMGLVLADLVEGFQAGFTGSSGRMTEQQMQEVMANFEREMMSKQNEMMAGRGTAAREAGASFLAENKTKEGVVTTESGLQYKVIRAGEGKQPAKSDTVKVNYRGTLLDGTVFDSSYDRGEPVSFPVGGVIPGWTEALLLMKQGCQWELYIPSDLAYGPRGAGGAIGPDETLIFSVELLEIKGSDPPAGDPPAEEKPADDMGAAPADDAPASDPPAEEKPAADKTDAPAEEAPAKAPPADEKPAADKADPAPEASEK